MSSCGGSAENGHFVIHIVMRQHAQLVWASTVSTNNFCVVMTFCLREKARRCGGFGDVLRPSFSQPIVSDEKEKCAR